MTEYLDTLNQRLNKEDEDRAEQKRQRENKEAQDKHDKELAELKASQKERIKNVNAKLTALSNPGHSAEISELWPVVTATLEGLFTKRNGQLRSVYTDSRPRLAACLQALSWAHFYAGNTARQVPPTAPRHEVFNQETTKPQAILRNPPSKRTATQPVEDAASEDAGASAQPTGALS